MPSIVECSPVTIVLLSVWTQTNVLHVQARDLLDVVILIIQDTSILVKDNPHSTLGVWTLTLEHPLELTTLVGIVSIA